MLVILCGTPWARYKSKRRIAASSAQNMSSFSVSRSTTKHGKKVSRSAKAMPENSIMFWRWGLLRVTSANLSHPLEPSLEAVYFWIRIVNVAHSTNNNLSLVRKFSFERFQSHLCRQTLVMTFGRNVVGGVSRLVSTKLTDRDRVWKITPYTSGILTLYLRDD